MKDQFISENDKLLAEQAISKSHLGEDKKKLGTLCLYNDEISNKIKSNYGLTIHKLSIINIIYALHREIDYS